VPEGDKQEVVNRPSPAAARKRKWFAEEHGRRRILLHHRDSFLLHILHLIGNIQTFIRRTNKNLI
jgi:hypothetical protein